MTESARSGEHTAAAPSAIAPYVGPAAWRVADLERDKGWILHLTAEEAAELERATRDVLARGLAVPDVTREDFPLPVTGRRLAQVADELEGGRGFQLTRGLDVGRFGQEEAETLFWGLGLYLGIAVTQNYEGHLMGHVRDTSPDPENPVTRGYHSNKPLRLHSDSADCAGLFCLRKARSGGESMLVSTMTLHNEMLEQRPDLLAALYEPFYLDRKGEDRPGRKPYYPLAIYHRHEGTVTSRYNRAFIETSQRFDEVPRLTDRQVEAMDFLDELAERDDLQTVFQLEEGDIHWVNSYVTLHGRRHYEDHEPFDQKRHLLRLWLTLHKGRPLPDAFRAMYGSIEPGRPRTGFEGK